MAQARNTFIRSKLNKDLDARLLPQGEYRDAFNVQVSKSEGSSVGSLENVLGNYEVLDLNDLTGTSGLSCIGEVCDDSSGFVYLFLTNNNLASYEVNADNFIIRYDISGEGLPSANVLVQGAFLNFSTQFKIHGVNILEGLLYWTDNHNQPRVINTSLAEASLLHYVNEDQISVAKYNPYKCIELYDVISNEPESTMHDVTSKFYPNGGLGSVSGSYTGGNTIVLTNVVGNLVAGPFANPTPYDAGAVFSYINLDGDIIDTTQRIASFTYADSTTTPSALEPTWTITLDSSTGVSLVDGQEVVFNANPYYESTFAGDPDYLESLFARFSYRFKFEDNEYSVLAPFTQIAFIPKQDGYFIYTPNFLTDPNIAYNGLQEVNDQDSAYASTIVSFVENKTDKIKLRIPLPSSASTVRNDFKIKELDILFKESDGLAVRLIDTISIDEIETQAVNNDVFEYNYLSKKPYKTLSSSVLTRVYDKTPVRAFSQEIISNRIVYGNFQDKHTPLPSINYSVTVSEKEDFDEQKGEIRITTIGSYPAGTAIPATFTGTVNAGSPTEYPSITTVFITAVDATTVTFDQDITASNNNYLIRVNPIGPDQNYVSKVEYPNHTVKQNRNYQVGIVLQDRFGRSSSVILSNNTQKLLNASTGLAFVGDTIYSPYVGEATPPQDWPGNSLKVLFNEPLLPTAPVPSGGLQGWPGVYNGDSTSTNYNPLGWYSYKIVVKQTEQEYYNVYAPGIMAAYPARQGLELSKTSHMVLIGDNINKVPRDLNSVGPDQKQFRSSVQLYGRVENNDLGSTWQNVSYPTNLGDTNGQYYTGRNSNTVSTVSTLNDLFEYDPALPPIPNFIPQFYQYESNPLLARISTPKKIGQISTTNYSPSSAEARDVQTTTPADPDLKLQNVEGTILVNSIISSPKLAEGLLVAVVNQLNSPSIQVKDSTGTPVYVSLDKGDIISFRPGLGGQGTGANEEGLQTPGIQYLAVYETEPVESLLDIYWETSTSGLVTDLNSLILNESGGGADFSPINSIKWTEDLASGEEILSSDFTVQDSFGTAINPSFLTLTLDSVFNQNFEPINVQLPPLGPYFTLIDENDDPNIPPGYYNIIITQNYFDDIFYFREQQDNTRFYNFNFTATVNDPSNPDGPQVSVFTFPANPKNISPKFDSLQQQPANNDTVYKNQYDEIFATYFVLNGALNNDLRWQDLDLEVVSIFDLLSDNPTQDLLEDSNQQNDFFTFDGSSALQVLPNGDKSLRCDLKSGVGVGNVVPSNYEVQMFAADAEVDDQVARRLYINMVFTPTVIQNEVRLEYCPDLNDTKLESYVAITVENWAGGSLSQGNGVYMYKETTWQALESQSNGTVFNLNLSNAITSGGPNNPVCSNTVGSYNRPIFAADRAAAESLLASICYTCPGPAGGSNQYGVVDWTNQLDVSQNTGSLKFQVT
tara:strand:- start:2219 stop:6526 length:4308 start_codon:yes stop_codon:yes gene_type:complete